MKNLGILGFAAAACAMAATGGALAFNAENDEEGKAEETGEKPDPKFEKIGEPVNCLRLSNIRSSNVVDGQTIDFRVSGNKTYRNTLPRKCARLSFERAFSYRTSINKLCNVDIIRVLDTTGFGIRETNACGLGKFQEIKKIKDKKDS